eukprot:3938880-Rhodomonas_salina.1
MRGARDCQAQGATYSCGSPLENLTYDNATFLSVDVDTNLSQTCSSCHNQLCCISSINLSARRSTHHHLNSIQGTVRHRDSGFERFRGDQPHIHSAAVSCCDPALMRQHRSKAGRGSHTRREPFLSR